MGHFISLILGLTIFIFLQAPNDFPELDFVKPKYYLPAQAHPVLELSMYKGLN